MRGRTEQVQPPEIKPASAETPELFETRPAKYKPTQFLLADDMKDALKERSYRTGRSMSELVREAIDQYLQQ